MPNADTIAAIASPPGRSARAIVRISGPATPAILRALLDTPPTTRGPHTAVLRLPALPPPTSPRRTHETVLPLPVAVLHFPAPRSYTADHAAELLIPGNPHLARRVLDAVLTLTTDDRPVRLAHPGEFTQRAYLAAKLTLDQAEGVAALIAADRDADLDAARDLLTGTTGDRYRAWADDLAHLLALVEAGIDFTDQEDVVPIAPPTLADRVGALHDAIRAHAGDPAEARPDLPTVALVGPPSAGKSTLFNALLRRERSVTDDAPGTTRDAIAEPLDLTAETGSPAAVTLLDLPGLDLPGLDARSEGDLDRAAQASAVAAAGRADLLVQCDPAGRFEPDPRLPDTPTLRVRTKADLPGSEAAADLGVCALDGFQLDALRAAIADRAIARGSGGSAVVPRHARALADAAAALADARDAIDPRARALAEPEIVAGAMRTALDELGSITGDITPDEVIGRVFAAFCVGK